MSAGEWIIHEDSAVFEAGRLGALQTDDPCCQRITKLKSETAVPMAEKSVGAVMAYLLTKGELAIEE